MSEERDPVRWADAASDCDPLLRRALGNARAGLGDSGLPERVEQAVRRRLAAESGHVHGPDPRPAVTRSWTWIGAGGAAVIALAGAVWLTQGSQPTVMRALPQPAAAGAAGTTREQPGPSNPEPRLAPQRTGSGPHLEADHRLRAPPPSAVERQQDRVDTPRARPTLQSPHALRADDAVARVDRGGSNMRGQRPRPSAADSDRALAARARRNRDPASAAPPRPADDAPRNDARDSAALDHPRHAPRASIPRQGSAPPELQLLSDAQRALRTTPGRALELAEQHAHAYPHGRFVEEREEIAISALLALGEHAAASTRIRTFLTAYPDSLAAPRMAHQLEASP